MLAGYSNAALFSLYIQTTGQNFFKVGMGYIIKIVALTYQSLEEG
jgi:hypothetical protein